MWYGTILCTSLLASISTARPNLAFSASPAAEASVHPLHVFPNGTAAESLLVRDDGSVLLGMLAPSALLYYLPASSYSQPTLLYNFTGSAAVYGITEYAPDVFAVCTGTFSRSGDVTNATGRVWTVDLSGLSIQPDGSIASPARVSSLANITDTGFLNGAATLGSDTILVADSVRGVVYSVDTQTGRHSVVLNDTTMAPNATGAVRLGVNGLRIVDDTLYYTNTNRRSVDKVRLNANGTAAGPFTNIATNILVDDLEVDPRTGAIYVPSLTANSIAFVAPNGTVSTIAGSLNSTDVPGPTSIRFSNTSSRHESVKTRLFISTSGGIEYPINGTYIQGGGLYELDVSGLLP